MVVTYKDRFNKKYGFPKNTSHSLEQISKLTGFQLKGLKMIQKRGEGAFFSSPGSVRPQVKSPEQWGRARVYASVYPNSKSAKVDKKFLVKS
jgi:hypothetical protein